MESESPVTRGTARTRGEPQDLRVKWTDNLIARLADAIRPFGFVYDHSHPQHHDRHMRNDAWITVAKSMGVIAEPRLIPLLAKECERKYKNLRDELMKSLRKPRRNSKPYKHAEKLSFISPHLGNMDARTYYYEDANGQLVEQEYDDSEHPDAESAYAAAQLGDNGEGVHYAAESEPVTVSDVITYSTEPYRSSSSKKRKAALKKESDTHQFASYSTPVTFDLRGATPQRSSTHQRVVKEQLDELDDFSNMLVKRLRRFPPNAWGLVMSRLMETLSNTEETIKRPEVKSSGCQTGD